MQTLTIEQAYQRTILDVKVWCRFGTIDNLLEIPSDDEIKIAINIALDDINSFPPKTSQTVLGAVQNQDAWYTTLMYGACKNILWTLLCDWTANGIDAQLDSLSIQSKRPDYEALFSNAKEQFENRLERIKKSYGSVTVSSRNRAGGGASSRGSVLRPAYHSSGVAANLSTSNIFRR